MSRFACRRGRQRPDPDALLSRNVPVYQRDTRARPAEGVLSQLPADTVAGIGETVTPSFLMDAVRDGAGEWTFSGWTPADQFAHGPGVAFTGSWTWTALPVYSVDTSSSAVRAGRALPEQSARNQLPAGSFGWRGMYSPRRVPAIPSASAAASGALRAGAPPA